MGTMDKFSSFRVICNDEQSLSRIEWLTEFDDALQVVVEDILVLHVQFTVF